MIYYGTKGIKCLTVFLPPTQTREENGSLTFTCMQGEIDCHVSRIQLCGIHYLQGSPDRIMEFVACQMNFYNDRSGVAVSQSIIEWFQ